MGRERFYVATSVNYSIVPQKPTFDLIFPTGAAFTSKLSSAVRPSILSKTCPQTELLARSLSRVTKVKMERQSI